MGHSPISYPADYDNNRTLRREHHAGLALVWTLVVLIVISATMCMALSARGIRLMGTACAGKDVIESIFSEKENPAEDGASFDAPETTPKAAELPPATPVPPVPTVEPNPDFMNHAAQPFSKQFESLPDVIEAVAPGVVGVTNWQTYEKTQKVVAWGSGSGFIITTDGYVVTNHHVIENALKVTVNLRSGEEYEARVVGSDRTTDIAVLKIEAEGLTALPRGDSDKVRVGEFVFAIGDPVRSELSGSVTFGIVSAKARDINIDGFSNSYIQTDAAINLGNSGGPLITTGGFVIGMNSAKTVTAGYDAVGNAIAAEGIGFAIPINQVWDIASRLITTGSVPKPGIGITIKQTIAELREVAAEQGEEIRPYVDSITPGGPAEQAGMKAKDVILAVDGIEMDDMTQIVSYIREHTVVGQEILFTVEREGEQIELRVTVGDLNNMP